MCQTCSTGGGGGGARTRVDGRESYFAMPEADDPLAESRREWGSLPPRVRRELAEGVTKRLSEPYRGLTERYFEALTQEP